MNVDYRIGYRISAVSWLDLPSFILFSSLLFPVGFFLHSVFIYNRRDSAMATCMFAEPDSQKSNRRLDPRVLRYFLEHVSGFRCRSR